MLPAQLVVIALLSGLLRRGLGASHSIRAGWLPMIKDSLRATHRTPTLTRRKRAGAAPWLVWMICDGCPLPQLGVPHRLQWRALQTASQLFQNWGVTPV